MKNNNSLKRKALIFGAGGQVGSELVKLIPDSLPIFHDSSESGIRMDTTDAVKVEDLILKTRPDVIINAAAFTNVDVCETNKENALRINAESVKHMVRAASVTNSFFVHISTDYVFDGKKGMYNEKSVPNPINYYGLSKLLGDWAALSYDNSLVVRTSGVFGYKQNYPRFVVSQLESGKEINAVRSYYSPVHAKLLAESIIELIILRRTGIINVAGPRISRYQLALEIAKRIGVTTDKLTELDNSDMKWTANRPFDSSLDCSLAKRLLSGTFYDLDSNLDLLLKK